MEQTKREVSEVEKYLNARKYLAELMAKREKDNTLKVKVCEYQELEQVQC